MLIYWKLTITMLFWDLYIFHNFIWAFILLYCILLLWFGVMTLRWGCSPAPSHWSALIGWFERLRHAAAAESRKSSSRRDHCRTTVNFWHMILTQGRTVYVCSSVPITVAGKSDTLLLQFNGNKLLFSLSQSFRL